jgi:hypothetical protein
MQSLCSPKTPAEPVHDGRIPEARYSYYRRCQVFRRNGVQCKAPAENGANICHAHAGQLAMAVRRERERRAVLMEAVAEMRRRGKPECEMADLFTSFNGIQVTLAVMSRAVITGRIDCKTAGRLVVHLQTLSKLLWQIHRKERKGRKDLPLIHTDLKKLPKTKPFPRMDADLTTESRRHGEKQSLLRKCADERRLSSENWAVGSSVRRVPDCAGAKVLQFKVPTFGDRSRAHGPPELKAA